MQKTIKMMIPATEAHEIEQKVWECDICLKSSKEGINYKKCKLCDRDICSACSAYDPEDNGDYPDKYCLTCISLKFGKYKNEFKRLEKEYDKAIEALNAKIKDECLNDSD